VQPAALEARDLRHFHAGPGGPDVQQSFDLETVAIHFQPRQAACPERVEAIAQVRVPGPEQHVDQAQECAVSSSSQCRDVGRATPWREAAALRKVGTVPQSLNESGYLFWLCRAIGIERYDDVAAGGGEATRQRVAFTDSALMDHPYIRPAAPSYSDSIVIAVAIDQDHLE
jgi:hypothetical protein